MGLCSILCGSPTCKMNGCTNKQQWEKDKQSQPPKEKKDKPKK